MCILAVPDLRQQQNEVLILGGIYVNSIKGHLVNEQKTLHS